MLKKDGDKKAVHIMFDKDDYSVLQQAAKDECRSVSSICRHIVDDYIKEHKKSTENQLENK